LGFTVVLFTDAQSLRSELKRLLPDFH